MRRSLFTNPWPLIILIAALVAVIGLAPRSLAYSRALHEAGHLLESGQPLLAAGQIAQAAEIAPGRIDLWEQAGRAALQGRDPQLAIRCLERGAAEAGLAPAGSGGLSLAGWTDLGDAYRQSGDQVAALRAWQVGTAFYGPTPAILERMFAVRLALGNFSGAVADLQSLADLQPEEPQVYYRMGLVLAASQPEDALGALDRAAALDPAYVPIAAALRRSLISARRSDDPVYSLMAAGRFLASLNEWGLAFQAFGRATTLRPDYAEAWAYRGEARQHPGEGDLLPLPSPVDAGIALNELETALALDPRSLAGYTFLALYWSRQGRNDLAPQIIDRALSIDPHNPALWVQKANAQAASGDLLGAEATYRLAVDMGPGDPAYRRYWIGFMLEYNFQVGSVALPVARQLVIDFPQDPASLDLMAQVFIRLGDLQSAGRFLDRALQVDSGYALAYLHRGQVYGLVGNPKAARQTLERAQALDPTGPINAQARRWIESFAP